MQIQNNMGNNMGQEMSPGRHVSALNKLNQSESNSSASVSL